MADPSDPVQPDEDALPTRITSASEILLEDLLRWSVLLREDWEALPPSVRQGLARTTNEQLLARLVEYQLLTPYQVSCLRTGQPSGLVLGNYRVLDRLGAGGMGVVFKAEHMLLRRPVALKILAGVFGDDAEPLLRFLNEIRLVASLQHPNIVAALDAGKTRGTGLEPPGCYYLVMELVPGEDLDRHIRQNGPLSVPRACDLACQVAGALAEAHQRDLIHRDIKPPNILLTPEGQAKLLDFGLARRVHDQRLTVPGTILGSLEYMTPEQAGAPWPIDHRSDLYALGGVLCWCLTGRSPFPARATLTEQLVARQNQPPPRLREVRPDLPAELEEVVVRMMALRPDDRYPTAQAVLNALLPFLGSSRIGGHILAAEVRGSSADLSSLRAGGTGAGRNARILIADDDPVSRRLCRGLLEGAGLACDEVPDGRQALEAARAGSYDLVLLDVQMPELMGPEVLRQLREDPPGPNLKVVMLSAEVSPDEMAKLLSAGANDYLAKPPSAVQLRARVKAALAHKEAEDRSDLLHRHLLAVNAELERGLRSSAGDLTRARNGLLHALAELAELRTGRSVAHLSRLSRYCRCLAEEAAKQPVFADQIDEPFLDLLECSAPLRDIGLAGLPEPILKKPGKLDLEERLVMQTHTTLGAELLQRIARRHRVALTLLQTAADIARHHHENHDGTGYPDRLAGNAIPLTARLVAVADVYDALRSRRPHRPPLSHIFAVQLMTEGSPGRFDPQLLAAFRRCVGQFERIFREVPDAEG